MKCACKPQPRYKHLVTIEEPNGTPDASGHVDLADSSNWKQVARIKVNFATKGGKERRAFDQVEGEVHLIAKTRSTPQSRAIHPVMRLVHEGKRYNIAAAYDVDNEKQVVQMELVEVV